MERAYNPTTGEVLFQVNGEWVPPSQIAKNPDTGEMAYEVNGQWEIVPALKEKAPKAEMPSLGFGEEDIKKAQQQLREQPVIGLPRKAPAPPPPAPPQEVKGLGALMENVPKRAPLPSATLPVSETERRRVTTAWENATPEQRKLLESAPGYVGVITKELAQAYPKEVPKGALAMVDPRREAREEILRRKGYSKDVANYLTNVGIASGVKPGEEEAALFPGKVEKTDVNFDIARTFAKPGLNNPIARGVTKGALALGKASLGVNQAIADGLGLEDTGKDMVRYANKVRGTEEGLGEKGTFLERNLEGAISSIAQQAPSMFGGAITGRAAISLGSMIVNSFGQEYSDGRAKGLDGVEASARAALYAALEGIGERFGIKGNLSALKKIADGMPLDAAKEFLSNTLKKELPGELFTTTGQFVTDLAPGIGLNPNATFKDYLGAVGDTVAQTIMQGGIMSGASAGLAKLQERGPSEKLQYAEAEGAKDRAIRAWEDAFAPLKSREPKLGELTPSTKREPTIGQTQPANKVEPSLPQEEPPKVEAPTAEPKLGIVEEEEVAPLPSIKEAFQGAAKGMTDNLYQGIFDAQQKGETKVSGIEEPVLIAAKEAGITFNTPEEVRAFANDPQVQVRLKEINVEQQVRRMVQNGQTVGQIQQKLPNVDVLKMLGVVDQLPVGNNVEYHIVKTPTGYVANMFDVDSGNYVPGSARIFPTKNFGDEAEVKAREFAQEQIEKAKPFQTPEEKKNEPNNVKVEEVPKTETPEQEISRIRETLKNPNIGIKQRDELEARLDELEAKPEEKPTEELKTETPEEPKAPATEPLTEDELSKMFDELSEEAPEEAPEQLTPQHFSEEQLDAMFEEIAAGNPPPKVEPAAPKEAKTPTVPGLLGSAAKETGTGLAKSIDALGELFGAGDTTTLRSGIGFDEETYAKAKPIFLEAISHLKQAASDIRQAMKMIIDMVKAKFGQPVLERMKKYVIRFIQDVQSGAVKTEKQEEKVEEKEAKPDLLTPEGKFQVAQELADYLIGDGSFKTIVEARQKIGEITGQKIEPGTELAKQADETVETAIVLAAREIIKAGRKRGNQVVYDRLVGLLNRQPNLATRSSESIRDQAYSTPVPLAYLASELAGVTPESKVLEPTAGNGMLLIGASVNNAIANELNPTRAAMMRALGFTVTTQNAATNELAASKSQDVVIANPPFGAVKDENGKTISFTVKEGYSTNEIDHAIAFKALETMKDKGRAVLIVGGVLPTSDEGRTEAYRGAAKRAFYYNLYNQYNIVDHFTVAGDLYTKQGASYPVDVIVIEGRGESERALPAAELPKIYNSWDELKEKLNGRVVSTRNERPAGTPSGENQAGAGNGEGVAGGTGGQGTGTGGEGGTKGVTPSEQGAGPAGGRPGGRGAKPSTGELEPTGVPKGVGNRQEGVPGEGGVQSGGTEGAAGNGPAGVGGPSGSTGERVGSKLTDRRGAETETATQVEYVPRSNASSVGTLSPVAMQQATQEALDRIVEQQGDIDNYVAEALEMEPEDLRLNFSAEQVDALALAISNAQAGKGFIIGDQTGIGKGRVVAAMIKYALVNDKIPIFVTEKPNLYADMIRDLDDIGMTNELGLDQKTTKIFMTNSKDSVPYTIVREINGEVTETNFTLKAPAKGKDLNDLMAQMQIDNSLGNPPFYKVIFTTYSQLQAVRKATTERQRFINHFAAGNYIILDESHNAGGAGEAKGKKGEEKEEITGRAGFVRGLVQRSFGSFFSSATYAKRPDVMSLYSSTNMSLAVDNPSQLGEAIKNGGVPMQQAVATMLTKDGQYIRRERTFAGVSYDTVPAEVDKVTAENMASAMRSILAFSRAKEGLIREIQKDLDKKGEVAGQAGERTTVQSANFGSIMHNLIDQMLLALKVQQAVKQAIDLIKAGEKPVLTVSNTMGSFLADYAEEMGLRVGDPVSMSFKDMYMRYLKKQRIIKIKSPNGQVTEHYLSDQELGPTLTEAYNRVADQIEKAGFGSAPISPIDYIKNELEKVKITDIDGKERNVKVDEITGREVTVNYGGDTPVLGSRSSSIRNRVNAVRGFNNGTIDALILNQAGSTGLSLHASSKVKDKKKRHMIIVQAEKNIDTHMQMLGRVHRTGQVIAPAYSQMMADIPAEMRPASVLMKKMASLNANTTASRKSAVTAEGVVDFMNDYGGQVAQEFLRDNPEIHNKLGGQKILPLDEDPTEADEGDIRKLTGYIPILPIEEQEKIYTDLISRYNELIASEDSLGTNKLEAKSLDLDAKTLSFEPITEQKEDLSLFAAPAIMERIDVKRTVKPYSSDEVRQLVKDRLNGEQPVAIARAQEQDMRERAREYYRKVTEKLQSQENPDPVKIQAAQDVISASVNKTVAVLQNYRIGTQVTITDKLGQKLFGVITNVTNSKRTENPAAGSDWKINIAVSNGEDKTLPLNFSQIGTKYELAAESTVMWYNPETQQAEDIPVIQTFDKGATVRREKRWLVSGNLLAGFAKFPGQIISYTKEDGTTGQGILMSRQFDWAKVKENTPVEFANPREIMEFLNSSALSEVGTPDKHLLIKKRGNRYIFSASKPKRSGGQYHQDRNLTDLLGNGFYGSGAYLTSTVYQDEQFINGINYLVQKGVQLIATSNQKGAREAREQKLKGSAPSGSLSQNAQNMYMSGRRSSKKMSKADIDKMIQPVRERGQVPEIVVVQKIDSLPENILNEMRASGMELAPGLFHQDSNRIFLIADNIAHPQALWMTVAHELAGHYGLRAVLGEDYAPMMNAIYDGSEEVRKNVDARLQRNRDQVKNPNLWMTKEEAVEEYVAEKAEKDPKLKWVNRLVNAIKTFLRKIGFTIPVGDSEVIRLIRDANKYTYGDAVRASWTVREAAKGREKGFARGAVRASEDAFKKWFKNSKAIDDDGEPMTFYHATKQDFTEFKPGGFDPTLSGPAIWFSPYKDVQPAAHNLGTKVEGTRVMPVYLSIQSPLMIDDAGMLDYAREVFANGSSEFPQLISAKTIKELKEAGYDGIIFDGENLGWGKNTNEWIVFDPTQIKSVFNRGTFSPNEKNIMYRQDDEDLIDKYNRPNVPMLQTNPVKDWVIDAKKASTELFRDAVNDPQWALGKIFNSAENAVLYLRNKFIWFGAGLNARDFERYKGALQDSHGLVIASVALDNAISSGNIGVQVVMQGGLKFDNTHKRFVATETPLGMVGVYKAQAELKKKLGDQLGENIIQGYLEAKRSKSIKDEYAVREQEYKDAVVAYNQSLNNPDPAIQLRAKEAMDEAEADLKSIKVALDKVNMSDEEIQEFIARDQEHPELQRIMSNWTAVNQNLLKVWKQVGLLSDKRYDVLSQIPDYVPWYRIMSEDEDVHSPIQSTTKTLQNIGREKIFKEGKSRIVTVFTAEANQKAFEIQPSSQVSVKVNGKNVPASKVSSTPDGQVTLNMALRAGDQVVITANREIENIIDNMTQNVMRMTMNAVRQYAASRIVSEYGTRNAKGQIRQFESVDPKAGKFYFVNKGRRIIVQIQDPLVAEAIFGMKTLDIELFKPLVAVANLTRRLITISPTFQLKQIFQDAPTAALVSGVKNPAALMGGVFNGFVQSLRPNDPIVEILRSSGIGGFYSPARTPEAEVKRRIGVLNNNVFDYVLRGLDHWGDASDMAQRRAIYIRVLKETGDANLALYQAANVINFLRRGSGRLAQAVTKTVPFMAAYANQIDVLAQTLLTGGLKGMDRLTALARLAKTGTLLMGITLLYCFAVGDDEEYLKLDDQTRLRNFIIPGTNFVIPMNTAAAYFFKAIPEMFYNAVVKYGTDNEVDGRRLREALSQAAMDLLLGPNPLPSGVKTVIEIGLNKDFWSGKDIVPKRLEKVLAEEQYTAATSELGKTLSKLSNGALNPMQMDHIVKSTFGSAGALAQYFTNLIGEASGERPETPLKQTPLVGPFVRPEVPRGREELFYDLKDEVDTAYNTLRLKFIRQKDQSAEEFREKNAGLIALYKKINKVDEKLQNINQAIRLKGESTDKDVSAKEKREDMVEMMKAKNDLLDGVETLRREAGFSEDDSIMSLIGAIRQ